jgi:tetratricopeptide (TPR) repeat protein
MNVSKYAEGARKWQEKIYEWDTQRVNYSKIKKIAMKTIRLIALLAPVFFASFTNAQTSYKRENHSPTYFPDKKMSEIKASISNILQNETAWVWDREKETYGNPKDILVLDDRIEFMIKKQKTIISYSDLSNFEIGIEGFFMTGEDDKYYLVRYELTLGNIVFNYKMDYNSAIQIANDLFFIQKQQQIIKNQDLRNQRSAQLTLFESVAAAYRTLKVKPPVSEEQRKYIIQANLFNQKHEYNTAIVLYNKATEIDPTSYPSAYSNLALLSAQIHKFDDAIYYMKKYLMLEPDAEDARSCQDKIYEWEIMMQE